MKKTIIIISLMAMAMFLNEYGGAPIKEVDMQKYIKEVQKDEKMAPKPSQRPKAAPCDDSWLSIGMNAQDLIELWGYPTRIYRTVGERGKIEQWVYRKQRRERSFWEYMEGYRWQPETSCIYIKNDKVTSWQSYAQSRARYIRSSSRAVALRYKRPT